jgi:hypothetical protein
MNGTTSRKLMMSICGLAAIGLFVAAPGCSSSGTTTGTGGHTGGGGSTGGGGHGTGGSTGTGGAGVDAGPPCTVVAAPGSISDFPADAGTAAFIGGPYAGAQPGLTSPTFDTTSGALVMTFNTGMASMMYPYAYVGLPFNSCANASAYTGIKFSASGTLSAGCTIQFSTIDKEHIPVAMAGGLCTAATGCYPSALIFALAPTATDVTIKFADQTGGGTDTGNAVVDPTKITGIQWQVNPVNPMAGDAGSSCAGSVTIDNITFM